ncbi:alpha/beta hydrolase family esterase [Aspergillus fischeri NRRL 181]|uniref:Peptidase S9 prolyl oligopeptidase catalytic domain-containing protein n=1 Tax=Neosartorya fischeri (strain ATCC 1020 / DSM 3700 / CBS 544.65 / FGSC A1164 / JCM 1740 / NRRL 181 / WB 181) TaxID=331117 RepID=A1DGN3_NEOFI|nr:uncharacterized protein NFIA_084920 [Aspergillus fischeri NRRL 181]EAW18540.1 hypothetical protein NFIA_084920 [Aspergillus fischeri NRRL 181]KAG2021734.1 hypothetical protein GB937_004694 [Aspergillus fischeri]
MAPSSFFLTVLLYALTASAAAVGFILPKAGSLEHIPDFGPNPTNVSMYIYVPKKLAAKPGIVVAIYYCTGTAEAYYTGSPYAKLAEQYDFIQLHADMVAWTKKQYKVDCSKMFVTGSSSGAMMTNVMAATYPELFAAGIADSDVAAGCFMSATDQNQAWNSTCSQGKSIATPEVWAGVPKAMTGIQRPTP